MQQLWEKLKETLQASGPLALAYSGGLDSRLVAHAALSAGCDIVLFHARGAHIPRHETEFAIAFAKKCNLPLHLIDIDVSTIAGVKDNYKSRCYYCKKFLIQSILSHDMLDGRKLCDGTNADDLKQFRPGLGALKEFSILSPLALSGIDKSTVRALAQETKLEMPEQKASPCLLTRLNYGMQVESATLQRIDSAENALRQAGLSEFRLRLCPEIVLQTVAHTVSHTNIHEILAAHGFNDAVIVEEEEISGYFDR